ncbi:MarR family winged helix-turn-helix transcriptional regulator [Amycolatopsis sp. GM8]|uniref:MarR family winged helix-turn-helix transcriptional regulator n=1 Tax=Amycolatopsis sp. GM8 TaxID=2896530 RepID=UPI001F17A1F4|nr:MarR family winged helix-turn-helix transcriptional regulator [Amycolatopsis sp. GM8]
MDEAQQSELFELADLILAVSRLIHASKQDASAGESWTPLESAVMRFIDRNPGTSASAAAESTQLISSNFSRAVRGLEKKGLVRREVDAHDARRVRLYPTERAQENLNWLKDVWSRLLDGIVTDPEEIQTMTSNLRRIETELVARTRRGGLNAGAREAPAHPGTATRPGSGAVPGPA